MNEPTADRVHEQVSAESRRRVLLAELRCIRAQRMHLGELRRHQVQPVLLVEGRQLVLELEPLEHVDVGREPRDVVHQVRPQALRVLQEPGEVEGAGVVEREPGLTFHLDVKGAAGVLRGQRPHLVAGGFEDAVEASQDRERQDDPAVLVRLLHAAELIGDPPHEVAQLAQTRTPSSRLAATPVARTLLQQAAFTGTFGDPVDV